MEQIIPYGPRLPSISHPRRQTRDCVPAVRCFEIVHLSTITSQLPQPPMFCEYLVDALATSSKSTTCRLEHGIRPRMTTSPLSWLWHNPSSTKPRASSSRSTVKTWITHCMENRSGGFSAYNPTPQTVQRLSLSGRKNMEQYKKAALCSERGETRTQRLYCAPGGYHTMDEALLPVYH
jgi:hypothetical protein